ncbi:unnamed protein product, partial [Owenia fusiformis]
FVVRNTSKDNTKFFVSLLDLLHRSGLTQCIIGHKSIMYTQYFILVLCLLLLGGSNSAKSRDRDNGWEKSNTMSREKGEHHKEVKKQEIWIDDEDEGSGPDDRVDPTTDDEDMWDEDGPSGHGMNDDEEG